MKKIVITGGPCGGKSTVLAVLKEKFAGAALVVPAGEEHGGLLAPLPEFSGIAVAEDSGGGRSSL